MFTKLNIRKIQRVKRNLFKDPVHLTFNGPISPKKVDYMVMAKNQQKISPGHCISSATFKFILNIPE